MKLLDFPRLRQTYDYDCGAKSLQSALAYYGIEVREDYVMKFAHTCKTGTPITGIEKTIKKYGLKYESREMTVEEIKSSIDKEIPVIVVLQAWAKRKVNWKKDWKDGHYVVVIGYNSKGFIFEDPSSFERTSLTYGEFKKRWHDVSSEGKRYVHYGISVFGKKPKYDSKKIVKMR